MRRIKDKYMIRCKGSEGSSLAIALFFFLLCSLMCAGILFLANSSGRGVSKSLANAPVFEKPATPPAGTIQPGMTNDELAVQIVYDALNADISYITENMNNWETASINSTDNPLLYSIITKAFSYFSHKNAVNRSYTVTIDDTTTTDDTTLSTTVKVHFKKCDSFWFFGQYCSFESVTITVESGSASETIEFSVGKNDQIVFYENGQQLYFYEA